jgi:hypothetical protein
MKPVLLTALAVIVSACSSPPVILAGADPADPSSRVPGSRYMPVTSGTLDYRPIDPKPWVEQNQGVAPKSGGE